MKCNKLNTMQEQTFKTIDMNGNKIFRLSSKYDLMLELGKTIKSYEPMNYEEFLMN